MAHHSEQLTAELKEAADRLKLGATGDYPQGKLNETDEGEIQLAVTADTDAGKVLMNFGTSVVWIGFDYEQALALADSIRDNAFRLRGIDA